MNKLTQNTALTKIVFASDFDNPDVGPSIENTGDDTMTFTGPFSFSGILDTDDDVSVGGGLTVTGSTLLSSLVLGGAFSGATGSFSGALTGLSLALSGALAADSAVFTGLEVEGDADVENLAATGQIEANIFLAEVDEYGEGGTVYAEGDITSETEVVSVDGTFTGDIVGKTISAEKDAYDTGGTLDIEGLSVLLGGAAFNSAENTDIQGTDSQFTIDVGGTEVIKYTTSAFTRTISGASMADIVTNYFGGTSHNTLTLRAARGTSAAPAYLNDADVVGTLKFEARDGAGTWGDVAEIRAVATDAHGSGDTPGGIHIYGTKDGSDTQTKLAAFESYIYAPGVLNLELPRMDTRMVTFWDYGSDVGFGYFKDVLATLGITVPDGVTVFDSGNAAGDPIRMHFGVDDYIYLANSTGTVVTDGTFRFGINASDYWAVEQYDSGGTSWDGMFHHDGDDFTVDTGSAIVGSTEAFYFGDKDTNDSWRFIRDGNNLVAQRRESGTWTTKDTITP